jgi:hypothetical protein
MTGQSGQDSSDKTADTGQGGENRRVWTGRPDRSAWTAGSEHDSQNRTGQMAPDNWAALTRDSQNSLDKTAGAKRLRKDSQDSSTRTGQPGQVGQNMTVRTEQLMQENHGSIARKGQRGKDSLKKSAWTGRPVSQPVKDKWQDSQDRPARTGNVNFKRELSITNKN